MTVFSCDLVVEKEGTVHLQGLTEPANGAPLCRVRTRAGDSSGEVLPDSSLQILPSIFVLFVRHGLASFPPLQRHRFNDNYEIRFTRRI